MLSDKQLVAIVIISYGNDGVECIIIQEETAPWFDNCFNDILGVIWNRQEHKNMQLCMVTVLSALLHSFIIVVLLGKEAICHGDGAKENLNNPSIIHRHRTNTKQCQRQKGRSDRRNQ